MIERIMEKEICEQRRDRRPLWGTTLPLLQGAVGVLYRCFQPPLNVQHHPFLVGVRLHRLDDEVMRNVVEEPGDVTLQHPRVRETTRPACRDRIQRRTTRPVPIGAPDGTSVPPISPVPWRPPSGRPGPRQSAHPACAPPRHVVSAPRQASPAAGNTTPRTSGSTSHTSLFRRSASKSSIVQPSTPGPPWFAFTFLNASTTACFGIANGLSVDFGWFTGLLPTTGRLITENFPDEPSPWLHAHYRPFTATTRRSASKRGIGTQPLTVSAARSAPSRPANPPGHIHARLPTFPTKAADEVHATSVPDTAWPIHGHPPDSSRILNNLVLMSSLYSRHVNSGHLPRPHLTHHVRLFHIAHDDGLQPTPHVVV